MAARTFQDSRGDSWEVFEVHRASKNPGAVSAGLEQGWLAFVRGEEKRRLAPFPEDWERAGDAALERLCGQARVAVARLGDRSARPRISGGDGRSPLPPDAPDDADVGESGARPTVDDVATPAPDLRPEVAEIEDVVRTFAHEARTRGMPAVDAMVSLKAMLLQRFPGAEHPARDNRLVRRAFVDTYYFNRDA